MQQEGLWQNDTSNDTLEGRSRRSSTKRNSQHNQELSAELRKTGAGDGNRTHVSSLGSYSSTIELRPHGAGRVYAGAGVRRNVRR